MPPYTDALRRLRSGPPILCQGRRIARWKSVREPTVEAFLLIFIRCIFRFRDPCFGCRFIGLGHASLPRRPRLECPLPHFAELLPAGKVSGGALAAASIVRSLETSLRRGLLSQHHREVTALPPDEADVQLNWCEETPKPRSTRELRGAFGKWSTKLSGWSPSASAFKYFLPEGLTATITPTILR